MSIKPFHRIGGKRHPPPGELHVSVRNKDEKMMLSRLLIRLSLTIAVIIITMISIFLSLPVNADQAVNPLSVDEKLDAHVKKYIDWYETNNCEAEPGNTCRGTEYKKARRFIFGDINGDGKKDVAALYTLESFCCGNNYHFFLAVFLRKGSTFELVASEKVGGKGERGVRFNTIRDGKILLDTDEYLPDDPMCCPSSKGSTTYSLKNGKLVESNRVGEKRCRLLSVIDGHRSAYSH